MKHYIALIAFIAALLLCPALLLADSAFPLIKTVNPNTVSPGDSLTITGDNLDAVNVAALYLTDGSKDCKVMISSQTKTAITFMIPVNASTGRFALMILTAGETPKLVEEPVKVTVE